MSSETKADRQRRVRNEVNHYLSTTNNKIILVEGPSDKVFFDQRFSDYGNFRTQYCDGKKFLQTLLEEQYSNYPTQLIGVRDADFSRYLKVSIPAGALRTDLYDIVADGFFLGDSFSEYSAYRLSSEKISKWLGGSEFTDVIIFYCSCVGLIRYLIKEKRLDFELREPVFKPIDLKSANMEPETLFKILLKRSGINGDRAEEYLNTIKSNASILSNSEVYFCRGHDIAMLLELVTAKFRKSKTDLTKSKSKDRMSKHGSQKISAGDLEAVILGSYQINKFKNSDLYKSLKSFMDTPVI